MAPFCSEPAIVEVEPADGGADGKGCGDGVELEAGSGDFGAAGDDGAGDDGSEVLGAFGKVEGLEAAAKSVEENVAGCVVLWKGWLATLLILRGN